MQLSLQLFVLLCSVIAATHVNAQNGGFPPRLSIPGAVASPHRPQVLRVRRPVASRQHQQQNAILPAVTPRVALEERPVTESAEDEQPDAFLPSLLREQQLAQAQQSQFQQAAAAFLNNQPHVLTESNSPTTSTLQQFLQHEDTQPTAILPAPPRFGADRPGPAINRPAFNDFGIGRFETAPRFGIERASPAQPAPPPPPPPQRPTFIPEPTAAAPPPQRFAVVRRPAPTVAAYRPEPQTAAPAPRPRPKPIQSRPIIDQNQLNEDRADSQQRRQRPVAQTIRKWREENEDGSITWGYENDDGSFKEEIIGIDCVTKGTYGYIDPDGNKREYQYETGIKCDPNARDNDEELQENGFINYEENRAVLPNGLEIDMTQLGKKKSKRPNSIYRN